MRINPASTQRDLSIADRFNQRYREGCCDVASAVQEEVFGADLEVNGYTTRRQADALISALDLDSSSRVLDLGAGNGWPGVYVAATTGCGITLTDLPRQALTRARARSQREGGTQRCDAVQASAIALPFAAGSFDAIVHTDVMCCLSPKVAVLRACRRLLRKGGRMAFITIHTPRNLDARARRQAYRFGPRMVNSRLDYPSMLRGAGFHIVHINDLTTEYLRVSEAWVAARERHEVALSESLGAARVHEMLTDGRLNVEGIRRGLLRRSLLVATK